VTVNFHSVEKFFRFPGNNCFGRHKSFETAASLPLQENVKGLRGIHAGKQIFHPHLKNSSKNQMLKAAYSRFATLDLSDTFTANIPPNVLQLFGKPLL
jgi:hypothetical protein